MFGFAGLGQRSKFDLAGARRRILIGASGRLGQCSPQEIIPIFAFVLCFAAFKASFEFEPNAVNLFCCERYFMAPDRSFAEELVEKAAAVALQSAVPRNVSRDPVFIEIDLQKFTLLQKAV